ncbi:MAG: bacteriohemerythrin [Oryzomonas sp.]|uniref:bacteriohemerythrin n=1 Tax=Oryzomonas sp. TaxID=2855186 RepID=UPI0028432F9E|nr:bacteriohemerythrin [Oryzomonas sp.]MDR3580831.1 bacteriohemerythrin [Oryzomonas sp.]
MENSKLILAFVAAGIMDDDLDNLLARLLAMLQQLPSFRVQPRGVVRMFNPRGGLISIAQHGFQPVWLDPATDILLAKAPRTFCATAHTVSFEPLDRAIVLPLATDSRQLGQAILFIEPDWVPSNAEIGFMNNLAQALSGLVNRCLTVETLKVREFELEEARIQTIRSLGEAAECRDHDIGLHVMRMSSFAVVIAKALGLSDEQRELLYIAAPMHDVGKIGIADDILLKPGKLTDDEFDIMKTHTEIGERLLYGSESLIMAARDIASSHHENWDGSGYPHGLKGEGIPLLARICSVADVFDALISTRPYKCAWSIEDAITWILCQAGKKFDPIVVKAFEAALPEIRRIRELYREDIINPTQTVALAELVHRGTRWISWDETLRVGIDVIDEHHRYLFDLANELIGIVAKKLELRAVGRLLSALEQYAQVHFHAEERMMEHYGYADLEQQKHQHQQFTDRLLEFRKEFHDNPLLVQFEAMAYLREWLEVHIRHEDARLKELVV